MATVEQEIKMMSEKTFEAFVHQVLLARHPTTDIKRVDGSGGDQGIDCFLGTLADCPVVWQCKHFQSRIGPDQKRQVIESIETAFRHRTLSAWSLCVPIDLRLPEHEWFQEKIVTPYSLLAEIRLIQNSDLVADVLKYRTLSDLFFPDTGISNLLRLRDRELGPEFRDQLLEHMENTLDHQAILDPRLAAMMIVGPSDMLSNLVPKDTIFSINRGRNAVHFIPQDKDAYSKDPIFFSCTFRPEAQSLIEGAMDTGDSVKLPAGSILGINVTSELLQSFFPKDTSFLEFELVPLPPLWAREMFLSLIAGRGRSARKLSLLRCRQVKSGRKELTLEGETSALHVSIRIQRNDRRLYINFRPRFTDSDVRQIRAALDFLYALEETGKLDIYDAETEAKIYSQDHQKMLNVNSTLGITSVFLDIVENALDASQYFDTAIRLPGYLTGQDVASLKMVATIIHQGQCSGVSLNTTVLKRSSHEAELVKAIYEPAFTVRVDQHEGEELNIFGVELRTKPLTFWSDSAKCVDPAKFAEQYRSASEGQVVPIALECDNCRFSFEENVSESTFTVTNKGHSFQLPTS